MKRNSKYWDNFLERADETISCFRNGLAVPVRRVAVFVTERCQLHCQYCNHRHASVEMTEQCFDTIAKKYGTSAIIHITGGEPGVVKWLYPYLNLHAKKCRFHLNTNAVIAPPAESVKRLKVSLDSCNREYWNSLVGARIFDKVVQNIKNAIPKTVVSITFTMTKENYLTIPSFIKFYRSEFKGAYALFFSVYKGTDRRFAFDSKDADILFNIILPQMKQTLDGESRALLDETLNEKFRIAQGVRFPENIRNTCYLSLSERAYRPDGTMSGCSHLMRDGIIIKPGEKHDKCKYGCNRRLVAFNQEIEERLKIDESIAVNLRNL